MIDMLVIGITSKSVAEKASGLKVTFESVTANELCAIVIVTDVVREKGRRGRLVYKEEEHVRDVIVHRDGNYTCTCTNFLYSKATHLNLWKDNTRTRPECKHAIAVKLTDVYKSWIRMILVPVNGGYSLRSIENIEHVHVKSLDEHLHDDWMPKPRTIRPKFSGKIPFDKIFKSEE